MAKHYKNEKLMKFLTVLGALIGLATLILSFFGYHIAYVDPLTGVDSFIRRIIGFVIVLLTFLVALKPNKPLPFHWLVLFILGILLIVFSAGIFACVLLVIAALIGLIEVI